MVKFNLTKVYIRPYTLLKPIPQVEDIRFAAISIG
jgi:hypothetical protein